MNKKIWGVIIIILALIIIAGLIYFILINKFSINLGPIAEPPAGSSSTAVAPGPAEPAKEPAAVQPISPLKKLQVKPDDLSRMAAAFAERFGSFSNQSDYGNLRDLQIFMTANMKSWAQDYINTARRQKADASIYYGLVTKAISSEVRQFDFDLGRAEIMVRTQRRESTGVADNSSVFYQDIIIKYLRENGVWRVAGANWQGK